MKNKPICSSCGREINEDEILRSVALVGAARITEYIVCDGCFMRLTNMFRDNPQNQPLKRLEGRNSGETRYYCDDCVDKYIDNIIDGFVNAMQKDDIKVERIC